MAPALSRKFGAPLFFCSFTQSEDEVILGGGGGSSSTGVANRLLLVDVEKDVATKNTKGQDRNPGRNQLEENPKSEIHTGDSAVISGAFISSKKTIVCGMTGEESIHLYKLSPKGKGKQDKRAFEKVQISDQVAKTHVEIKVITASADGSKFAVGLLTGEIYVYQIEGLKTLISSNSDASGKSSSISGVMNLFFTPDGSSLIIVRDSGRAFYWNFSNKNKSKSMEEISTPKNKVKTMLRGCYACKENSKSLSIYAGVNQRGRSSVAKWILESDKDASKLTYRKQVFAYKSAITVLTGSSPGDQENTSKGATNLIATGSSEGDVTIYCARTLAKRVKVQSAHMIFVTNLAFSPDGKRLVSVSADAGARITTVVRSPSNIPVQLLLAIFFALIAFLLYQYKLIIIQ